MPSSSPPFGWALVGPGNIALRFAGALKGIDGAGPVILAANCTNCGRCIDVCSKAVFAFGTRFGNKVAKVSQPAQGMKPAVCK